MALTCIDVAESIDANGVKILVGDKVFYSGSSNREDFAIGTIKRIVEYRDKKGKLESTYIYFGKIRSRKNSQVIKILK